MNEINKAFVKGKELIAKSRRECIRRTGSDRLPPGQRLIDGLEVLDLGIKPDVSTEDWSLEMMGKIEIPITLDWDQFHLLEQVSSVSDFHCVTTWSSFDCEWRGVRFSTLLEIVSLSTNVTHVLFHGFDNYTTNVALADLLGDDVLLATSFNGKPLTLDHGAPCRVIVPHLYAWKGAKWVSKIEFLDADKPGFWEVRGYSNTADPWTEDRYI